MVSSFKVCNVPKMKNVEYNGGRLSFRNYLQCQSGYRNLTSLKCEESGLEKSPEKFKCCESGFIDDYNILSSNLLQSG